jgi:virulence-associated protein VagC
MIEARTAKLFKNGASVTLPTCPESKTWDNFFELMRAIDIRADFMRERPMNTPPNDRNLFGCSSFGTTVYEH